MVPAEFQPFFIASVGASAALIGLLFVSVSVAPERVFGGRAESLGQARALSAFTALANVFFISCVSLIPHVQAGFVITVIGLVAVLQTLGLLTLFSHWRAEGVVLRSALLFTASAAIYGGEVALGILIWTTPANTGALSGVLELMLGAYALGLARAWELLGAPRTGPLTRLLSRFERRAEPTPPPSSKPQ